MKNTICLILHGCPRDEASLMPKEKRWMTWLAGELNKLGMNALAPDMPTPWAAKYRDWKLAFEKLPVSEGSILVGHSCAGAFLVRWLLDTKLKVKKLILVAPAKFPSDSTDPRADLYNFDFPENAPQIADEVVVFVSNDSPHNLKSTDWYIEKLKPRVIRLEGREHFLYYTTGTNEFLELLEEITNRFPAYNQQQYQ